MDYRTPNDVALDVASDEGRLIPNLDEQLPLEVCSSTEGCFIYDAHGAEVGYTYKQDWENDPKGYIVWMAEELRKVYETPVEALKQAAQYEPMFLFYDSEYPTDDVSCKQTNEATLGKGRELPPLNGREPTDPKKSPFTIVTEDHYTEEQPSAIRISDGETISEEWFVEHTEDAAKNTELGAEIAWNIRLAMSDRGSSETKLTGLNHPQLSFRVKETERVDEIPDADCRSDTYYSNVGDVFRKLAEGIE